MVIGKVKKENVVGFRVNDVNYHRLEKIANKKHAKKSEIVRKALINYLYMNMSKIPIIMWGRNEMAFTLSCMDDSQIKQLAELSYKNGIESTSHLIKAFGEKVEIEDDFDLNKVPINFFLNIFLDFTLSTELLNFFDSIEWSWIEKPRIRLQIIGNHSINENFSIYIKYLMENYLNGYDYALTKEVLLKDMMIIEFTKNDTKRMIQELVEGGKNAN